ncbi:hypothetical protein UY3_05288 [Chelonia mydas]|uniref:Uncharacterized protein n=1 Tax=Chelonia mydas TaxID=8469 RepID=M7BHU6_CHEMY|nr:hypothetical protein UY3_05288 [Chelonia mydas]
MRFSDELHAILGGAPTTTPALCVDSINGLSRNRDADFGDEEDDDEEEVEAQQACRETVFPDSQEMFFTLDLVPSQPTEDGLPDLEGREGTSAANVSSLPLSSLFQRLSKIRSRKKRTHDEIFSELMQASHAERAQHNAWRETMSESRKAQNEREEKRDNRGLTVVMCGGANFGSFSCQAPLRQSPLYNQCNGEENQALRFCLAPAHSRQRPIATLNFCAAAAFLGPAAGALPPPGEGL